MTTPLLPIFSNTPSVVTGTSDAGNKGSALEGTGQGEGNVAFSEVLGQTQQVLPQTGENSKDHSENESVFSAAIIQNQDLLNELTSQGLIEDELNENVASQLYGQGLTETAALTPTTSNEVLIQNLPVPAQRHGPVQGVGQSLLEYPGSSADPQRHPGPLHTLVPVAGQRISNAREGIVPEIAEQNRIAPSLSILNRLSGESEVVTQAVAGQGVRVRPLLNENTRPILETLPSSGPVTAPPTDSDVNVQRLLSALEGTGSAPKAEIGTPSGSIVLPLSREEHTLSLSRVDGDAKTIGAIGSSQSGEAGFGTPGGGLPFGNHAGSGQGQLLDSSSGNLLSTSQGQLAAKGGSFDDRLQLLNTPVPQRLQIDVQLSEVARVQVDVGVQQRQVYAGVLMDNPVLRALASQNVQDLENQLGQAEMELEEFDVHGDNEQYREQLAGENVNRDSSQTGRSGEVEVSSASHVHEHSLDSPKQDRGWHLVA